MTFYCLIAAIHDFELKLLFRKIEPALILKELKKLYQKSRIFIDIIIRPWVISNQ